MKFNTNLPKDYTGDLLTMPPFDERGKITKRVSAGLENALFLYSNLAKIHAQKTDNNPDNFSLSEVYVVGSGARENKIDSDLDLLFLSPIIDEVSANHLKTIMSYVLFCDREKREAVDVFIRAVDRYSDRGSVNITPQVGNLINKYNKLLLK